MPEPIWWRSLSGYQWFVVAAASAAWLFDTLDQLGVLKFSSPLPLRYAAVTMCAIFPLGLVAAYLGLETKDKRLPA
ncbi:MAG TPA: hypothetical protein VI320_33105 [Terracidiphilus sp.]|jgi:hypothetical protein